MTTSNKLDNVLRKLDDVKQNGSYYMACCPAHDDKNPSLKVSINKNGWVDLKCFAGCTEGQILGALGIEKRDLAPEDKPTPKRKAARRIVASYDYTDEDGALLFQAVRYEPKDFRQRRPNGKGGWIYSLDDTRRVLYRLPELLAADPSRVVFLVEGEKDADALRGLGLVATCNPMGAGKWDDAYNQTLAGRRVVILPDNDEPGRRHRDKVAAALAGIVAELRVVDLPNLPEKGDVSDWISAGGTVAALRAIVDATGPYTPSTANVEPEPADEDDEDTKSGRLLEALIGMGHEIKLNTLEDNIEINGARMDDVTLAGINLALGDKKFSRPDIADGIAVLAGRNRYHPVKDYLNSLTWDGAPHVEKMLSHFTGSGEEITYLNGDTQPLYRLLIFRWLLGCVAKALDGDNATAFRHQNPMLVLIGPQGIGKSSWVRWLASGIGYDFYREGSLNPHSIDDQRTMTTRWLWEVSELGGSMRRSDRDSLKAFITTQEITYRKPYGKFAITKPALCSLVGTLNDDAFLDDPTGHRRFLPAVITGIDHRYSQIDVNQVWAQLVTRYQAGESPELTPAERQALAKTHEQHEIENPLDTYVQMYFDIDPGNDDRRMHTAAIIDRLRAFDVSLPNDLRVAGRVVSEILTAHGLESKTMKIDGSNGKGWIGIAPNHKPKPTR